LVAVFRLLRVKWLRKGLLFFLYSDFINVSEPERLRLCDEIAYPDVEDAELQAGISFFSLMRDLTLTGYYTTEQGLIDLGYKGNTPNVWDGVPDEVLRKHNKAYYEAQ
jgi:gluconate 2-dehydrogenase gamma chain